MHSRFRKDPYLLQRYNIVSAVTLSLLLLLASSLRGELHAWWPWLPVTALFAHSSFRSILLGYAVSLALLFFSAQTLSPWVALGLITLGVYAGIWSNVLIHNAAHNIIQPKWLNRLVGEMAGLQLLSGFPGFALLHMEHHAHSDDAELDPHPNLPGQTYWQYIDGTRLRLRHTFVRMYRQRWGHGPQYARSWRKVKWLLPLNRTLRAAFLLVVLGPIGFTFFFLTSHIATQLVFAAINFYSHHRLPNGEVEVRNLDSHFAFWVLNRGFAGAFYHRNHHLNPKLFNPMKMRNQNA